LTSWATVSFRVIILCDMELLLFMFKVLKTIYSRWQGTWRCTQQAADPVIPGRWRFIHWTLRSTRSVPHCPLNPFCFIYVTLCDYLVAERFTASLAEFGSRSRHGRMSAFFW